VSNVNVSEVAANISEGDSAGAGEAPAQPEAQPQEAQAPQEEAKAPEMDYTRGWNALTRREKQIQQRESEFKEKMGEFEAFQQDKSLLTTDPVKFLEKNGWKFNDLADFVLNDKKKPTESRLEELQKRIDKMEEEKRQAAEEKKHREESEAQQSKINEYKSQIKSFITEKADDYELINQFDEHDTVYDVIESYYRTNNVILEVDKAAAEVEKYLEQQLEKAANTKKFKSRFSPLAQEEEKSEPEPLKPKFPPTGESQPPRTLSNTVATSTSAGSEKSVYLSDDESKKRAAEFLKTAWEKRRQA
jgi:hypothetical protein